MLQGRSHILGLLLGLALTISSPAFARSVTLAWDPNPENDIAGYIVYRGAACDAFTTTVDAGNRTSYTFTSLPDDEPHCFAVQAYNLTGARGPLSAPVTMSAGGGSGGGSGSNPMLVLDEPVVGARVSQPFLIGGWAADLASTNGGGVDTLHVYAYPAAGAPVFLGAATMGGVRPDVGAGFGAAFTNTGFGLLASNLAAGDYTLVVYAHSAVTGTFNNALVRPVTVLPAPVMTVDAPASGTTVSQPFVVDGWAIDPSAESGTGIDAVNAFAYPNPGSGAPPIFLGWGSYGGQRADVAAFYGGRFMNSRFQVPVDGLAPGIYMLEIYVHSTSTNRFSMTQQVTVNVKGRPRMNIDIPANEANVAQSFAVAGWAIDLESTSGSGVDAVHVYAFPVNGAAAVFLGGATLGNPRPDVAGAFVASQFGNAGFSLDVHSLAPGTYDIVVYARSTVVGAFNNVQIRRVTVQ